VGAKVNSTLCPYRVLDLTDEKGFLAGRILADLGAEVIKIERPRGDPSRNIGPFYHDIPDPEKSLYWFAFNANKRGITLNLECADGRGLFRKLAKRSDVIIESFPPGYLGNLGLGYEELSQLKGELIMASITPFGQTGPYHDFKASDLTIWCMGGMAYISGDPDRAPVRVSFPQSYLHAGAAAAAGTLVALYYRELTGEGQRVDVSIQEAVVRTLMNVRMFWDLNGIVLKRAGLFRTGLSTAANQRLIWHSRDGYVNFPILGGAQGARTNAALVRWMEEEGINDEYLSQMNWEEFDMAEATQEQFDRLERPISRFFERHTGEELYQGSIERGIMLYPVYSATEIYQDVQLKARDFWEGVYHPEVDETLTYPGSFVRFAEDRPKIYRRAPLIGEHNEEVYGELGLSREDLAILKQTSII